MRNASGNRKPLIGQILRIPCSSALPKHNDFAKKETQSIDPLVDRYGEQGDLFLA
jgi:hypothetical protein